MPDPLHRGVTAGVALNDLVAVGALARLREPDVGVPRDLSVVGFDDIPVAAFLGPPLTTVNVAKEVLGRRPWARLHRQMQDVEIPCIGCRPRWWSDVRPPLREPDRRRPLPGIRDGGGAVRCGSPGSADGLECVVVRVLGDQRKVVGLVPLRQSTGR